jgi:hypothetical protein
LTLSQADEQISNKQLRVFTNIYAGIQVPRRFHPGRNLIKVKVAGDGCRKGVARVEVAGVMVAGVKVTGVKLEAVVIAGRRW